MFRRLLNISIALFFYGVLAIIMSWALGNELRLIGLIGIPIAYVGMILNQNTRTKIEYLQIVLIIIWAGLNLLLLLTDISLTPYNIIGRIAIFAWLVIEFILPKEKGMSLFSGLNRFDIVSLVLMSVSFILILLGTLMKMMSFQFANLLMILGLVCIEAFLLKSIFTPNNKNIEQ